MPPAISMVESPSCAPCALPPCASPPVISKARHHGTAVSGRVRLPASTPPAQRPSPSAGHDRGKLVFIGRGRRRHVVSVGAASAAGGGVRGELEPSPPARSTRSRGRWQLPQVLQIAHHRSIQPCARASKPAAAAWGGARVHRRRERADTPDIRTSRDDNSTGLDSTGRAHATLGGGTVCHGRARAP